MADGDWLHGHNVFVFFVLFNYSTITKDNILWFLTRNIGNIFWSINKGLFVVFRLECELHSNNGAAFILNVHKL